MLTMLAAGVPSQWLISWLIIFAFVLLLYIRTRSAIVTLVDSCAADPGILAERAETAVRRCLVASLAVLLVVLLNAGYVDVGWRGAAFIQLVSALIVFLFPLLAVRAVRMLRVFAFQFRSISPLARWRVSGREVKRFLWLVRRREFRKRGLSVVGSSAISIILSLCATGGIASAVEDLDGRMAIALILLFFYLTIASLIPRRDSMEFRLYPSGIVAYEHAFSWLDKGLSRVTLSDNAQEGIGTLELRGDPLDPFIKGNVLLVPVPPAAQPKVREALQLFTRAYEPESS